MSAAGVTAIIIAHNSNDFLPLCLSTLLASGKDLDLEIIVFDNASKVKPSTVLSDRFPQVQFIECEENLGFGKACNRVAKVAKNDYYLFVNPDTMVSQDTIPKMLEFCKTNPEKGIVGCKILNSDGSLQAACRRSFPTPLSALFHTLGLDILFPKSQTFGKYNLTYLDSKEATELEAVSGSFFCVHKEKYWEISGFDEDFFLYGEDLDLCYRIYKAGYPNYYLPTTRVVHFKGHSANQKPWFTFYHFYLAMYVFAKKHRNRSKAPFSLVGLGIGFTAILAAVMRNLLYWKRFAAEFTLLLILAVLFISSNVLPVFNGFNWIVPLFGGWLGASFLTGRFSKPLAQTGIRSFLPLVFASIFTIVNTLGSEGGVGLGVFSLLLIHEFFFKTIRLFAEIIRRDPKSIYIMGEEEGYWDDLQKQYWKGDLIGLYALNSKIEQKLEMWRISDEQDFHQVVQTVGIRHFIMKPITYISAQSVIFSQSFNEKMRDPVLVFPSSRSGEFVKVKPELLQ